MKHQQQGGTWLGLVIGVVIGLAAALAVAVYVTKAPVPFVSKGQSRSAEQDAAETEKNKNWDPNAPLAGKNNARVVPSASVPVPGAAAVSSGTPMGTAVVSAKGAAAALAASAVPKPDMRAGSPATVAGTDILGDLVKNRAAVGSEPFIYFVQVGAFRTQEDAESQRAKLLLSGIETKVSEREQSGRVVFRVRVGPFDRKDDADKAKERLDAAALETALVRVPR